MTTPIASIVIPACNEAGVIGICLETMLRDALPGEFDVIVSANGCTDETVQIARGFEGVRVVELEHGSKVAALDLADGTTSVWPRIYVDADVRVDTQALRETARTVTLAGATVAGGALDEDTLTSGALAAAPRLQVDTTHSGWLVRAFYQIYLQIPWTQEGMIGSGLYALSEQGHARLGRFPDVTYDDLLVSRLFEQGERVTVRNATFTISAPRDVLTLIRTKTRVATSNLDHRKRPPMGVEQHRPSRQLSQYRAIARQPRQWPALLVYIVIYATTRARARLRYHRGDLHTWTRDHTTRMVNTS